MASLSFGNSSSSALIKSANTAANEIATYNDSLAEYQYQLSAKTDDDLQTYQDYLNGRINTLNASGSVTDASKALSLTKSLTSAVSTNSSSNIQRENIQVMAGNGSLTDKYNTIVSQYTRAVGIGDMSLAQSLESQAYSVNQSIQLQNQNAADAAKTLQDAAVSYQGDVVTSIQNGLKDLNNAAKSKSETDFNKYAQEYVDTNSDNLKALGVVLPKGAQPNYFNIVQGLVGAQYNALVLKAQAEAPIDPTKAQNYAYDAQFLSDGSTKVDTLGGSLSIQEIAQAAQDPQMFAYNSTTGTYKQTTKTGYQYENINGQQQVVPTYSGYTSSQVASKFYFLSPTETAQLNSLGLTINAKLNADGTVGTGITAEAGQTTPDWLKGVIGSEAQFFNQSGQLSFKSGDKFYTISKDSKGLSGLFAHNSDGSIDSVGGQYGFNAGEAQLLINSAQQTQQTVSLATQAQAAALKATAPAPLPNISIAPPTAPPTISVPKISAPTLTAPTVTPQQPTVNPQKAGGINQNGGSPQTGNFNPMSSGGGGIRL